MNYTQFDVEVGNIITNRILQECSDWYEERYDSAVITAAKQYPWSRHYLIRLDGSPMTCGRTVLAKVSMPLGFSMLEKFETFLKSDAVLNEFDALTVLCRTLGEDVYPGLTAIRPLACFPDLNVLVMEYLPGEDLLSIISHGFSSEVPIRRKEAIAVDIRSAGRLLSALHRMDNGANINSWPFDPQEFIAGFRPDIDGLLGAVLCKASRELLQRLGDVLSQVRPKQEKKATMSRLHADYYPDNIIRIPSGALYTIDTTLQQKGYIEEDIAMFFIGALITKKALLFRHEWLSPLALDAIKKAFLEGYAAAGTYDPDILKLSLIKSLIRRWLEVNVVVHKRAPRFLANVLLRMRIEPAFVRSLKLIEGCNE